jgi:hypothetical protein
MFAMGNFLRCLLAPVFIVGSSVAGVGQEPEVGREVAADDEIATDRDSFTPATSTVGFGRALFESSYTFTDNRAVPDAHSFPESLLRLGVSDWLELRVGWNFETGGPTGATSGVDFGAGDLLTERASEILYGAKIETSRQSGWMPQMATIVQGYTPTSGPSNISRVTAGEVFGWTLPNGWQWNSAIRFGTANESGDNFNHWAPSTVIKVPLSERVNVHGEYFSILSAGKAEPSDQHYASFGGHVLLTKDVELGVRFGFGLTEDTPRFFNNVGLGWRF